MTDQNTTDTTAQEPENGTQTAQDASQASQTAQDASQASQASQAAQDASQASQAAQDASQASQAAQDASQAAQAAQDASQAAQDAAHGDAETFPREYVEKLRKEAAEARLKAKKADDYARALFAARVAATGRLADASDLPFNTDLVDDLPALEAAIDDLLAQHPHYAARTPRGDIGQGVGAVRHDDIDLAAILRRGA